jgi:small subunit ribosomal protein S1
VSTPDTTVEQAPASAPAASSNDFMIEVDGKLVPNYDATMISFKEGDVVSGKVVRIDKDEVLVDIGYKSEGVIPSNELSIRKSVDPSDEVSLGEDVDALVLTKEDQEGRLILSKKRARFEKAWRRIEGAAESGEPVEGTVIEVVKGGLILDLGVRGFLPASLVDIRRVHNLDEFMGQKLECKVIELNRSRNNVVLSRRAVLEEERKEVREQILGRLQPGQIVDGKISNIVDFGAFVDLDGIDGLIHISELSWSHVNHPSEVVNIGDTVRVKVLDIDRDRQRISLGLKQTQEDPWQSVVDNHQPGDVLDGKVTKVVAFGAFVEILPGVEGLVHISELADHHVENPSEVVEPGTELQVKILEVDEERRRLSLSIKRVEGQHLPIREVPAPAPEEAAAAAPAEGTPDLDLSEEVFAEPPPEVEAEAGGAPEEDDAGQGQDADAQTESEDAPATGEDAGEEAHEGESAAERPDSPEGEEAAGEEG